MCPQTDLFKAFIEGGAKKSQKIFYIMVKYKVPGAVDIRKQQHLGMLNMWSLKILGARIYRRAGSDLDTMEDEPWIRKSQYNVPRPRAHLERWTMPMITVTVAECWRRF